ncbi:hypothetical protein VTL71DRAFT_15548 [Oculimacula yallundae]|uniref:Quinate repressor protein n=1 Tax=Oculimacula yallundae TaxID=86028 RepID=A0ABR4CGY2_9HELO
MDSHGNRTEDRRRTDSTSMDNVQSRPSSVAEISRSASRSESHASTMRKGLPSLRTPRRFAEGASIVLVGARGCGKTSLGYIAARALGWRLIEADDEFKLKTGLSRAQFLRANGRDAEEYRTKERMVMETMLSTNVSHTVMVCGIGSLDSHGQAILKQYALRHPVIHIIRETERLCEWLQISETADLVVRLEESDRNHRLCSNFEYYNLFDDGRSPSNLVEPHFRPLADATGGFISPPHVRRLQQTQQEFIRFVKFILDGSNSCLQALLSTSTNDSVQPADPRSTYALSIEFSQLEDEAIDLAYLECGHNAVEVVISAKDISGYSITAESIWVAKLSRQFAIIRRSVVVPIMFHVDMRSFDAAKLSDDTALDDIYLELLSLGVRLGAEFVTVGLTLSDQLIEEAIKTRGNTLIVGDHLETKTSQKWGTHDMLALYNKGRRLQCDLLRLRLYTLDEEDIIDLRQFIREIGTSPGAQVPLIAYNVGRLGRYSMCLNTILTAVTYPGARHHHAQGLLTLQDITRLRFELGLLDCRNFFIFGASVLYSLSPAMHNAGYRACGLPHNYRAIQASSINDLGPLLRDPSVGGAAISLPYKMAIMRYVDTMSAEAYAIGAVNTLIRSKSSIATTSRDEQASDRQYPHWHGDNTDWIGITTCIQRNLSPANIIRPWTSSLVVGAGGMARAAIYALIRLDVPNIFIYNRTVANAEQLASHFNKVAAEFRNSTPSLRTRNVSHRLAVLKSMEDPWPADFEQPTIIVACVPAHSIGGLPPANLTLPKTWLQSVNGGVVIEVCHMLAYKPLITPLITQIEQLCDTGRPWVVVSGLEVLPEQGIPQFELLTARAAPRRVLRTAVYHEYKRQAENAVRESSHEPQN